MSADDPGYVRDNVRDCVLETWLEHEGCESADELSAELQASLRKVTDAVDAAFEGVKPTPSAHVVVRCPPHLDRKYVVEAASVLP